MYFHDDYEQDFLECLAVLPEQDAEGNTWYRVNKDGLVLNIGLLWQEYKVVFSLRRVDTEKELVYLEVASVGGVVRVQEKWGDYLVFRECIIIPDFDAECWYSSSDYYANVKGMFSIEVYAYPDIRIVCY